MARAAPGHVPHAELSCASSSRYPPPPGIFVNADDKGVASETCVNADDKGLVGEIAVCSVVACEGPPVSVQRVRKRLKIGVLTKIEEQKSEAKSA